MSVILLNLELLSEVMSKFIFKNVRDDGSMYLFSISMIINKVQTLELRTGQFHTFQHICVLEGITQVF